MQSRVRSRGRDESLIFRDKRSAPMMGADGGFRGGNGRRQWRGKMAWTVALGVLLGILVWVGGGGLDTRSGSSSAVEDAGRGGTADSWRGGLNSGVGDKAEGGGEALRGAVPWGPEEAERRAESFEGEVTFLLRKIAAAKGLDSAEIEEARVAATAVVRKALVRARGLPEGLPPPDKTAMFPASCGLRVGGLPVYSGGGDGDGGSSSGGGGGGEGVGQRCCKVSLMSPPPPQPPLLSSPPKNQEAVGTAAAHGGRRGLWGEEDGRKGGWGGGGGDVLPAVLRTRSMEAVGDQEVSCFPSFIIAGTQKSGTTALTGILEQHPQVKMSEKKELHYFDKSSPNQRNAETYASHFPRFNASQATEHRAPFVVGEATPFYLASPNACMHMRRLVPDVRLVVLVREPVKRAWSEHQMKVRRVDEQAEMLELLPLHATEIYECAVKILPSATPEKMSERERGLMENPLDLINAIKECAGEIGQHGKWMDVMFPFIRRVAANNGATGKVGGKRGSPADALEGFREDISRCFPLKTVADNMEKLYPGGAWKQGWGRKPQELLPRRRDDGADRKHGLPNALRGRAVPPVGTGGGSAVWPRLPGGHRPPVSKSGRNGGTGPQHRILELYEDQDWLAAYEYAFFDGGLENAAFYWNATSAAAGAPAVAAGIAAADNGFVGLYGVDGDLGVDGGSGGGAAGAAGAAAAAGSGAGYHSTADYNWGGDRDWARESLWGEDSAAYRRHGTGAADSPPISEAWAIFKGEDEFDGDGSAAAAAATGLAVNPLRRSLVAKATAAGIDLSGVPWAETWGVWGKEGARTYDETCYQRMERVMPPGAVMRTEMLRMKACFKDALAGLGGLEGLMDANAVAAAEAIEKKISKCFTVTPGISDQYIYRSLYGVQAYRCLKHFPRDQVMFIDSDLLRDKPEEIMPKVHRHIGVPDYKYPSLDQGAIMAELETKYPDFEKRTGWRLNSVYKDEISEPLAKEIRAFVAPHMKMFARLTGQSFGDWAVDDRQNKEAMSGGTERANEYFEEELARELVRKAEAKGTTGVTGGDGGAATAGAPP